MIKPQSKREVRLFTLLFSVVYMISYITRNNYGAIISEMELSTGYARSALSGAITGSFITYGAGQVVSGICGDKFSPKKLLLYGLIVTSAMNALIPVCNDPYLMVVVWCVNGFAQSFMWPPLVRLMSELFSETDYKHAAAMVSLGGNAGTILVYLLSPLLISLFGWKSVFIFSAICGIAMVFVWNKYCCEIDVTPKNAVEKKTTQASLSKILLGGLMIPIMLAIICQGTLKDSVATWMPTYISETYDISNLISILSGVILPIFAILCIQLASKLYMNVFKNPLMCAGVFFAVGALSAGALYLLNGKNSVVSILLLAILTGTIHGVNFIIMSMIPPFFKRYDNVSTASGLLNACTYIGSAISIYGAAILSESAGWSYTLFLWFAAAALGGMIAFLCMIPWKHKMME